MDTLLTWVFSREITLMASPWTTALQIHRDCFAHMTTLPPLACTFEKSA
jgi:hypothetical protein